MTWSNGLFRQIEKKNPEGLRQLAKYLKLNVETLAPWQISRLILAKLRRLDSHGDEMPTNGDTPAETQPKAMER